MAKKEVKVQEEVKTPTLKEQLQSLTKDQLVDTAEKLYIDVNTLEKELSKANSAILKLVKG